MFQLLAFGFGGCCQAVKSSECHIRFFRRNESHSMCKGKNAIVWQKVALICSYLVSLVESSKYHIESSIIIIVPQSTWFSPLLELILSDVLRRTMTRLYIKCNYIDGRSKNLKLSNSYMIFLSFTAGYSKFIFVLSKANKCFILLVWTLKWKLFFLFNICFDMIKNLF